MIATILPGSADFHAVGYNEHKVFKGVATLLEMQNFGGLDASEHPTAKQLVQFLQLYSSQNSRIQKPQFHVAISCKGHEMTEQQLLDFAHQYLQEMGYAEPGQPWLIYAHHDTDNTHLHIVTSRVAPDGRKIQHDHERRRSQAVIDKILGTDRTQKTEKDIEAAKQYSFSSFAQFKAVMGTMGYEVFQKDGKVFVKQGGRIQKKLPLTEIEALYKKGYQNKARNRQLRACLKKYRDVCANKEELQKEMKKNFGVDVVFFGKKDKPYGYMLIDHANKTIIHGARVLALEELLDFTTPEQRFDRIEAYIGQLLQLPPKITQGEIFQKLKKQHAYIKKGVIYYDGQSRPLPEEMAAAINRNNRISFIEKFRPQNEAEVELLCKAFKVDRPDMVSISTERPPKYADSVGRLHEIFNDPEVKSPRSAMYQEGFIIRQVDDTYYAINFKEHILINLNEEGFEVERVKKKSKKQKRNGVPLKKSKKKTLNPIKSLQRKSHQGLGKLRKEGVGSHSANREWEVGKNTNYDEVDNGHSMKW